MDTPTETMIALVENTEYEAEWVRIAELTVDDLESGKYQQARGNLKIVDPDYGDSYCCLGVVCTHVPGGKYLTRHDSLVVSGDEGNGVLFTYAGYNDRLNLPVQLARKLNVTQELSIMCTTEEGWKWLCELLQRESPSQFFGLQNYRHGVGSVRSLASINDAGVPFPAIAEIMRRALDRDGLHFVPTRLDSDIAL
jgi:hypothetical protein